MSVHTRYCRSIVEIAYKMNLSTALRGGCSLFTSLRSYPMDFNGRDKLTFNCLIALPSGF